ncbi:MAG: hypothetical protein AAF756_17900 [Pseudomonadota bacterium]
MNPILVAFSSLVFGITIGFLMGLSSSPVVAVVLPILFSLMAGTSTFFFDGIRPSDVSKHSVVRNTAVSLVALCIGLIAGVHFGIEQRTPAIAWAIFEDGQPIEEVIAATNGNVLEAVALDLKLVNVGLGKQERKRIFEQLTDSIDTLKLDEVETELEALMALLGQTAPSIDEFDNAYKWLSVTVSLEAIYRILIHPSTRQSSGKADLQKLVDDTLKLANRLDDDEDNRKYIGSSIERSKAIIEFLSRLSALESLVARSRPISKADVLLKIVAEPQNDRSLLIKRDYYLAEGEDLRPSAFAPVIKES